VLLCLTSLQKNDPPAVLMVCKTGTVDAKLVIILIAATNSLKKNVKICYKNFN
jgi:hypothetical protein